MAAGSTAADRARRRTPAQLVRGWKLWQIPPAARMLILTVELTAVIALVATVPAFELRARDVVRWLLLAVLSVLYAETAARIERMRRYLDSSAHVSMTSVWAFTAVLCLPTVYAATLVAFLFAFSTWQRRHQRTVVAHRVLYSAATAILAALAASGTRVSLESHLPSWGSGGTSAVAVTVALVVYFATNTTLVLTTIYLAVGPVPLRQLLPDREELGLEIGTLVLGILTAETIEQQPWLTPLVLLLMVLLQRSSLVAQLEVAAATDAKTGLLNASAWQELAQRELVRSQHDSTPCAVLLMDLDHFKNVNDTLGHLAGDAALRAIGEALRRELRGYDAVARFGGEEFVVFLNGLGRDEAVSVAERTLARIRGLVITSVNGEGPTISLTASIGLAVHPANGADLTELLEAADSALYTAKRGGRDRVGLPPDALDLSELA